MGLLGGDPWKSGVRTTATIERVVVGLRSDAGDNIGTASQEVFLTFRYADETGAVVDQERRFMIGTGGIPAPGSIADIAYFPGKPKSLDYMQLTLRPPDPRVPRGWSAGIFEVEDL